MRDVELINTARIRRPGVFCKSGLHKMRLLTAVKIQDHYRRVFRCHRCGLTRIEVGST